MRLLCAAVTGPGHAYPMLAVAHALQRRGHDVVVLLDERHRVAASGLRFEPFPPLEPEDESVFRPYEVAGRIAEALSPIVARVSPDAAVIDLITLGAALACDLNHVPWCSLVVHPLHLPSRDLQPFGSGRRPARHAITRWAMRRDVARQIGDFQRGHDECNAVRVGLGLEPLARRDSALSDELVLVGTLPQLEPPRSDWPPFAHIVGPCLFEVPAVDPGDPPGDGPLVLIAASTAHDGPLLKAATGVVLSLGARAIITTGASTTDRVRNANVLVVDEAPHSSVMARADAVVCNGGGGIVARALQRGVPLVVLPQHGDQKENGARAARTGAAILVRRPEQVAAALRSILSDPRYRAAARRIASECEGLDGAANASLLVEQWADVKMKRARR